MTKRDQDQFTSEETQRHLEMVLRGADRDAFLTTLARNPAPAARLVKALKRHRRLFG